jgi:integrase
MAVLLDDAFADIAEGPPPDGKRPYIIYYDAQVKGFGLRVTKNGARSFILNYRNVEAIERRKTIGTFRDPWRTKAARAEALRLKKLIDQGEDPQGERNAIRSAPLLDDLIARYLADHAVPRKRPRSVREDEKLIRKWIGPELGRRRVVDLRAADIETLHRKITKHGSPSAANRCVALLSKAFNLAVRWEMRPDNPARGIERNAEQPRQRFLTPTELGRLLDVLAHYPNQKAANVVRVLVLSGARSGEVFHAQWDQFDLQAGVWLKPAGYVKTAREHRIPISAPLRQLLAEMRAEAQRQAEQDGQEPSSWLFASSGSAGHLTTIHHDWAKICAAAELSNVRVHDLRHTYASYLASSGLSVPIIGQLLGHTQASTTSRYSHLLDDPLRVATERVGRIVVAAGSPTKRNVVTIAPQRRGR